MNGTNRWFALPCAVLAGLLVWLGAGTADGQPGKDKKDDKAKSGPAAKSKPIPWTEAKVEAKPVDERGAFVRKLLDEGVALTHAKPATVKEANPVRRVNLSGKAAKDAQLATLAGLVKKGEVSGVDFREVKELALTRTDITDAGLTKHLQRLPDLERLHLLANPGITDAGLEAVGKLTKLTELTIQQENVTDEGLKHLKDVKGLRVLNLDRTKVTAAGLSSLGHLRLTRLDVPLAARTEAGLKAYLAALNPTEKTPFNLTGWQLAPASIPLLKASIGKHRHTGLVVSGKTITDEWLAALVKEVPGLELLSLSHSAVTDKGLEALKGAKLSHLVLDGTGISDLGLAVIQELPLAEKGALSLTGTKVTKAGVAKFNAKHPNWFLHGAGTEAEGR